MPDAPIQFLRKELGLRRCKQRALAKPTLAAVITQNVGRVLGPAVRSLPVRARRG